MLGVRINRKLKLGCQIPVGTVNDLSTVRGLRLNIFRHGTQDYSNRGISSRVTEVTLVGVRDVTRRILSPVRDWRVSSVTHDAPAVVACISNLGFFADRRDYGYLEPIDLADPLTPAGHFISRFCEIIGRLLGYPLNGPLRLHDRREY